MQVLSTTLSSLYRRLLTAGERTTILTQLIRGSQVWERNILFDFISLANGFCGIKFSTQTLTDIGDISLAGNLATYFSQSNNTGQIGLCSSLILYFAFATFVDIKQWSQSVYMYGSSGLKQTVFVISFDIVI